MNDEAVHDDEVKAETPEESEKPAGSEASPDESVGSGDPE